MHTCGKSEKCSILRSKVSLAFVGSGGQPANAVGPFLETYAARCRFALRFALGRLPTIRVVSEMAVLH
jgi:hypothetical protein